MDYRDQHQVRIRRRVEPHRLIHVSGRWYLVAYGLDRDDWRGFRIDRISPRTPTGPRFVPRELPGPDMATSPQKDTGIRCGPHPPLTVARHRLLCERRCPRVASRRSGKSPASR